MRSKTGGFGDVELTFASNLRNRGQQQAALVRSLQRDPLLTARVQRLKTVPGPGPITALTWALEMGDISRFRSIRQAISYYGLCGDERGPRIR
jgi:transposase